VNAVKLLQRNGKSQLRAKLTAKPRHRGLRISLSAAWRTEAQAEMTITKLYHGPDCTHAKDRDTACSCTLPFPLELSKTEEQAEEKAANSTEEANISSAPTIFLLPRPTLHPDLK
jgi:hypothetical protein